RGALAAGLMAGGLSLAFAVVIPPFQAPDEPNHFLGFMALGDRAGERPQADQWARIAHFKQLRFNGAERYRPVDARQPQEASWDDASPSDFDRRSSTTVAWRAIAGLTRHLPLPEAFLALRLAHACLLALAFAAAVWVVTLGAEAPFRHLAFVPLLVVPTLPFFGMHVSNHAFLASAYVLVASGILLVFIGGRHACAAGVLLGAGMGLGLIAGRSSLPLLPLVGAAAASRLIIAGRAPANRLKDAALFWSGFALCLAGVHLLRGDIPQDRIDAVLAGLPGPARRLDIFIEWPTAAGGVFFVASMLAEWRLARDSDAWTAGWPGAFTRGAALAAALLLTLILAGSLWLTYPHVASVDLLHRPPSWDYLRSVLATAATPRLRDADLLLTTSFWGGFGWLDRLLSPWAIAAYTGLTGVGLIVLLSTIARTRNVPLFLRGALLFLGAAASLAVYAVGTLRYSPDIHGRYLLGLYLAGLAVCGSPLLMGIGPAPHGGSAGDRTSVLLATLLAMYAAVLWFVLGAYF
ncbi:MAG: hypothetical protein ABJC51_01055, partial [Acidobacteriota bacterium]